MAKTYKKIAPIVTPLVILKFPKVLEPDMSKFSTDKCPAGLFKAPGLFKQGDPAFDAIAAKLQAIYDEGVAEVKAEQKTNKKVKLYPQTHPWIKADTDKEGNETGFSCIEARLPAMTKANPEKNKPARAQKPIVVDAMRANVPSDTQIWGGTTAKLSFIPSFYNMPIGSGVSLRLVGVQIINLVSGGGHTAASAGFGEEEGYTADESGFATPASTPASKDESNDDEEIPF